MAVLNATQLAKVAYDAGFRGQSLITAVAVALAESGGRSDAIGDKNYKVQGEQSVGPWQVNYRPAYANDPWRDPKKNLDPAFNAQAAFAISSQGSNFAPWTMYKNGGYKKFLGQAQQAAAVVSGGATVALPTSTTAAEPGPAGPAGPETPEAYIAATDRSMAWALNDPELGPKIRYAFEKHLAPAEFAQLIQQTHWYQTHTEAARNFQILRNTDPMKAEQQLRDLATKIIEAGRGQGVTISLDLARKFGEQYLTAGLSETEMSDAVRHDFHLGSNDYADYQWMNTIPELGGLLNEAIAGRWSTTALELRISQSQWYRSTPASVRELAKQRVSDPASFQAAIADLADSVGRQSIAMGVPIDAATARQIATDLVNTGHAQDPTAVQAAIANRFAYDPNRAGGAFQGQALTIADGFRQTAKEYGVPISDDGVAEWVKRTLQGTTNAETFEAWIREQAKSRYPWLAKQIDEGQSLTQYASPYVQSAANLLERPTSDFTLDNPILQAALGAVDKDGNRKPMGLWEFEQYVRNRPEYDHTKGALVEASRLGEGILQRFGMVRS